MHVTRLSLLDFRSYPSVELDLARGVSAFVGPNGQGKTNLVEAVDYLATGSSHRVATDQPLVRVGAERAVLRAAVRRDDREVLLELEINPGRANRARLNRSVLPRSRDLLGLMRTVVFAPEDLALVKGDPGERRRFLDDLLVARQPRFAGVRADYDRVLKQRNTLLKTAGGRANPGSLPTLDVWDAHLAAAGAELLAARVRLVGELSPYVQQHYADLAQPVPKGTRGNDVELDYRATVPLSAGAVEQEVVERELLAELGRRRAEELDRGITLVGPHRDDLVLSIGDMPARGYASHGESWSLALALRLAAFQLLREQGDDPVLVLDDVFAELDDLRRGRLAGSVTKTEQVLVTAAVAADIPSDLVEHRYDVRAGAVTSA